MDKHIPSHLIPFLDKYEHQNISEMEEVFSIKQDGMPRAERRTGTQRDTERPAQRDNNGIKYAPRG